MRKLASVQKILDIKAIEGADMICAYKIKGWYVVDKKQAYNIGDVVVYCEVDSWIPTEVAPFLSKQKEPSEYNKIKGERLRTVKLRGQLSQGLILPLSCLGKEAEQFIGCTDHNDGIDTDVSELLGIVKWEPKVAASLQGDAKGLFPSCVPKTDQERVQNLNINELIEAGKYEVTEKLHGSSTTVLLDVDNNFEVCSRNLSLKQSDSNAYWKVATKYNLQENMQKHCLQGYAIQGELVGEGILGNQYKLDLDLFVFDVLKAVDGEYKYVPAEERYKICDMLGLKHVPALGCVELSDISYDTDSLLLQAEGKSKINGSEREGLVFKNIKDPSFSFKAVSNRWLIKNKE